MDKWIISTLLYVGVLIGGFYVYDGVIADEKQATAEVQHQSNEEHQNNEVHQSNEEHQKTENHANPKDSTHGHEGNSSHAGSSEIDAIVQSDKKELKIFLQDKAGKPVTELEVNHEKLLHFIVVDEHLQQYYHLHPEQMGEGEFRITHQLPEGFYKAFVDIKPTQLNYHVTPVPFTVGNPSASTHGHGLEPDKEFAQKIDGETVKLKMSSFQINEPVTLTFDLDKTQLTPYLGAMGHVVILDEHAQNYLHVHPANHEEPIFETRFQQPGVYKIWAEFKQNGKVRAFPYVVEIKGAK